MSMSNTVSTVSFKSLQQTQQRWQRVSKRKIAVIEEWEEWDSRWLSPWRTVADAEPEPECLEGGSSSAWKEASSSAWKEGGSSSAWKEASSSAWKEASSSAWKESWSTSGWDWEEGSSTSWPVHKAPSAKAPSAQGSFCQVMQTAAKARPKALAWAPAPKPEAPPEAFSRPGIGPAPPEPFPNGEMVPTTPPSVAHAQAQEPCAWGPAPVHADQTAPAAGPDLPGGLDGVLENPATQLKALKALLGVKDDDEDDDKDDDEEESQKIEWCCFRNNDRSKNTCGKIAACLTWATGSSNRPKRKPMCLNCGEAKARAGIVTLYTPADYLDPEACEDDKAIHETIVRQQADIARALTGCNAPQF